MLDMNIHILADLLFSNTMLEGIMNSIRNFQEIVRFEEDSYQFMFLPGYVLMPTIFRPQSPTIM